MVNNAETPCLTFDKVKRMNVYLTADRFERFLKENNIK